MAKKFVLTAELQFRRSSDVDRFVSDLKRKFSDVNVNVKTNGTGQAVAEIKKVKAAVDSTNHATEELAKTFALSFKRFVSFSIATRSVAIFTSRLNSAFRKAREFEAEMIKVGQVTGKSMAGLSDLSNEINRLATNFGVYGNTLAKVSVLLSQAGFSARDTRIALDTLAKTELAPTFDNIIETTEGAIALFNQFGKGADALSAQLGAINRVAGAFAVESGDLIEVVRRVGGVFKSSGGDLNELISLFTSVRQTTRENAESIATALRTIFVRIQRPKTIEYLRKYGIELTDELGRFIGPLESIERIYQKFGNLPQGDLRLIEAGEVVAGFRQIGKFIPLIQQYRITQQALNVAKAGESSLDEDAIKAKEGLANKLSRLNEEFQVLIRSITESKTFKVVTNFFIDTTSAVIKLVDALKPLIPLFTAFAGIRLAKTIGGFSKDFSKNLVSAQQFSSGGPVSGYGNTDTVPAMLTPGEFVLNRHAAKSIGSNRLNKMNKSPQRLNQGGWVVDDGTVGVFTLDPTERSNDGIQGKYALNARKKDDRRKTYANGFPLDIYTISNSKVRDYKVVQQDFDRISQQHTEAMLEDLVTSSTFVTGLEPLKIDETHKKNVIKKFGSDPGVKNSIQGYLLEGLTSALIGLNFQGGSSTFDFDFLNKNINTENFGKLFGKSISPNLKLADAKRTFNPSSMSDKVENFISENSEKALGDYGFRFSEEGVMTGRNISVTMQQLEQKAAIEAIKADKKYYDPEKNKAFPFIVNEKNIGATPFAGAISEIANPKYGTEARLQKFYDAMGYKTSKIMRHDNSITYGEDGDKALEYVRQILREKNIELIKEAQSIKARNIKNISLEGLGEEYAKSGQGAVGYLDTDLMTQLGVSNAADLRKSIMLQAVADPGIKVKNIIGMAGSGKTTLAHTMAGDRKLFPITKPSDLEGITELINVSSEVTRGHLEYLSKLGKDDEVTFLSSTTPDEIATLTSNRQIRAETGLHLFGRSGDSSKYAPTDSRVSEALVQKYVKEAKVKFQSVAGGEKIGAKYEELTGDAVQMLGSFNPTTLGHVLGLTGDMIGEGIKKEDFLIRVGKGETPKLDDQSTWRTALFGDRYRLHLAKIGFAEHGFDNVMQGDFQPELGYVDKDGKVKLFNFALPGESLEGRSYIVTGGKRAEGKYESTKEKAEAAGFRYRDVDRSSSDDDELISGTRLRNAIFSGNLESVRNLLPEAVYKSLSSNEEVLKNRKDDFEKIFKLAKEKIDQGSTSKITTLMEQIFDSDDRYKIKYLAGGGPVPGTGNRDTVPAMLTPGEYVLNKGAVAALGMSTLDKLNKGKKGGKSKDGISYYSGGGGVTGAGIGAFAGISILASTFTQLIGDSSKLGQVFGALQVAGTQAVGSYYLMSTVVDKLAGTMADADGNIDKNFFDLFKSEKDSQEAFNNRIKELSKSFEELDKAVKEAEIELEVAKELKDPSQIEEKTNALKEAKRQHAVNSVISDPKKLKERIDKDKSHLQSEKTRIREIDGQILDIQKNIEDTLKNNPKQNITAAKLEIKKYEKRKLNAETNVKDFEERIGKDEELLNLLPKEKSSKFNEFIKGFDFNTSAGRTKIGGAIGGAGAAVSSGLSSYSAYNQKLAEKALTQGRFGDAKTSLIESKNIADTAGIVSTASQFASAGAAFGPFGVAIGAAGGALYGLVDVISNHSEKIKEINFKIVEESIASINNSMKQFEENLIGLADLLDKRRNYEKDRAERAVAGATVREAERRGMGGFERFLDRIDEYIGNHNPGNTILKPLGLFGYDTENHNIDQRDRNARYNRMSLSQAVINPNLNVSERATIASSLQNQRNTNLDTLKLINNDKRLNNKERIEKVEEIGKQQIFEYRGQFNFFRAEAIRVEEELAEATKKDDVVLKAKLTTELETIKAQQLLIETQIALTQSYIEQSKVQEQLTRINLNRIAVDNAFKSATLEFNRTIEEGKSGINVFARAIQEAEFYGAGNSGRLNQLKESNKASISRAASSGLINEDTEIFLQTQAARQEQYASLIDQITTGDIRLDVNDETVVPGVQIADQLRDQGFDQTVISQVRTLLEEKLPILNASDPNKVKEELLKALEPAFKKVGEITKDTFSTLYEYEKQLVSSLKERLVLERNYISEINNAINLRKEAEQIQGEFGGRTFTPARERELELQKLNQSLAAIQGGTVNALTGQELLSATSRIDLNSGQDRNQLGGGEEQRERVKTQQEALINAAKANIEIRKKEIEIIKQKNRLEQDAIKSLAQGDIEAFFNNIQSSAATDALAAGDNSILRQLGPRAIAGAVENLQSMAGAGITEFNGRSVNELVRQGNMAMATSTLGANSSVAQSVANQNAQISTAESDIRKSAEVLGTIGDQQYGNANIEFMHSTEVFNNAVETFKETINKTFVDVEKEKEINTAMSVARLGFFASGGSVFKPRGTDTIPAMLTPGEFVVRKSAVDKVGLGTLNRINQGYYNKGGVVGGGSEVYNQAGFEQFNVAVQMFKDSVSIFKDAVSIGSDVQALSEQISKLRESFMDFASTNMSVQLNPTSVNVNISDLTNSMRRELSESAQNAIIDRVVEELKRGRY